MAARRVGVLPAAGLATRLRIATPKELVVHDGRPVIDWSVDHLVHNRVERLVVVIRAGKEAVVQHLATAWPDLEVVVVHQHGQIGNLLDALRAAAPLVEHDEVHLLFPDTRLTPNPFTFRSERELTLLCHDAGDRWRHFGVVDATSRRVIEKPTRFQGSICWGAAVWQPPFTARLAAATTLTEAINAADWEHALTIDRYVDIGLASQAEDGELHACT